MKSDKNSHEIVWSENYRSYSKETRFLRIQHSDIFTSDILYIDLKIGDLVYLPRDSVSVALESSPLMSELSTQFKQTFR